MDEEFVRIDTTDHLEAQRSGFAVSKRASGYAFACMEIGSSNDPGWLSSGFYFYVNNEGYAWSDPRGGNLMEVFLKNRNPYSSSDSEKE